jgi:hypothetical protein
LRRCCFVVLANLCRDWGFDLKDVDSERMWLVHGDQDVQAPVKVAQWIDERLGADMPTSKFFD